MSMSPQGRFERDTDRLLDRDFNDSPPVYCEKCGPIHPSMANSENIFQDGKFIFTRWTCAHCGGFTDDQPLGTIVCSRCGDEFDPESYTQKICHQCREEADK